MDYIYSSWNSPGQNTGVGSLSLLQGIFPTQGLNPGLPHCRQILYQLSHKGSPRILEWVAFPFSRRSSQPRDWALVCCIAGGFFTNWAIRDALSCQPTREILPGESHGQKSLTGYSPWGCKESDTTERLSQREAISWISGLRLRGQVTCLRSHRESESWDPQICSPTTFLEMHLWLHWLFVSLVAAGGAAPQLRRSSFSGCWARALEPVSFSSGGAWVPGFHSMWNLPRPKIEPKFPALAGRFLTTGPRGKSQFSPTFWKTKKTVRKSFYFITHGCCEADVCLDQPCACPRPVSAPGGCAGCLSLP